MPGVPQILAALIAIISEGFEDAHYFAGGGSEESNDLASGEQNQESKFKALLKGHLDSGSEENHGTDIPTFILQVVTSPLYALAALWDSLTSRLNHPGSEKKVLSFKESWDKQRGVVQEEDVAVNSKAPRPSLNWKVEHTVSLIEQQKTQLTQSVVNKKLAQEKIVQLNDLQSEARTNPQRLKETLNQERKKPVYNKHRLWAVEEQTSTQKFIDGLSTQVELDDAKPNSSPTSTKRWGHFAKKELSQQDTDISLPSPQFH
jgi:hypothetical protein